MAGVHLLVSVGCLVWLGTTQEGWLPSRVIALRASGTSAREPGPLPEPHSDDLVVFPGELAQWLGLAGVVTTWK